MFHLLCSCESTRRNLVYYLRKQLYNHCGDDSVEDPPVLIPNTEVKLDGAESTWLDTAWEDRELPHFIFLVSSAVEHPAVNRRVVGPNPTRGAILH